MYIIICLDDNNGLAFNHRRQSQDRIVAEDISKTVGEKKLWITDYSRKLFQTVSNLEIRVYPADVSVEIGVEWKLTETEEFSGFSHEKITKEIYCRE